MSQKLTGYLFADIDTANIADPDKRLLWVHLATADTFFDSRYGKVELTGKDMRQLVDRFSDNVLQRDVPIDFSHATLDPDSAPTDRKAAGWVRSLEIRNLGDLELWALVEFTPGAWQPVLDKEWRYMSMALVDYTDKHSKKHIGQVLDSAALTNKPAWPGVHALVASEGAEALGGSTMDELIALIKTGSYTYAQLLAAFSGEGGLTEPEKFAVWCMLATAGTIPLDKDSNVALTEVDGMDAAYSAKLKAGKADMTEFAVGIPGAADITAMTARVTADMQTRKIGQWAEVPVPPVPPPEPPPAVIPPVPAAFAEQAELDTLRERVRVFEAEKFDRMFADLGKPDATGRVLTPVVLDGLKRIWTLNSTNRPITFSDTDKREFTDPALALLTLLSEHKEAGRLFCETGKSTITLTGDKGYFGGRLTFTTENIPADVLDKHAKRLGEHADKLDKKGIVLSELAGVLMAEASKENKVLEFETALTQANAIYLKG
jgi:hypothetical protein